ncbi:MAG: chromosomal replication initiator protein DnaA [Rikenellaceae bacterium]
MLASEQYKTTWNECLTMLEKSCSEEEFSKWFSVLEPVGFEGGVLRLKVPSRSHCEHIERNYIPTLRPIIRSRFGVQTRLQYAIPDAVAATAAPAIVKPEDKKNTFQNPYVTPGIKKTAFESQLQNSMNFESFIEGDCNRLARSGGRTIAMNPGTTAFNPLFVFGNSGLGKTHLAQAIGNDIKMRDPQCRVLYVGCDEFQRQFQRAVFRKEINDFIYFYQSIDVLIVDDIQEIAGKPATQNTFFNIFKHLKMLGKQVILTADRPPVELDGIDDRLITRFKWGLTAELTPPDYNTRLSILQTKAKSAGIRIQNEVLEFLAENIKANVRELEGALTSLDANAKLLGRKISLDLTRSIMRNIVSFTLQEVTIGSIIELVSSVMNVSANDLLSKRKTREISLARQIAMYICKEHTKNTLSAIGDSFGGRTHATVMYACRTVQNLVATDKIIRGQVEEIQRKLQY